MKENGQLAKFLGGCLWAVIFFGMTFMGRSIIANDEKARDRDTILENKIYAACIEQSKQNETVSILLAEIKKDLEYLKRDTRIN